MRKIENNRSFRENKKLLDKYLDGHLLELSLDRIKYKQKILELCHLGKFLIFYDDLLQIYEVCEGPDFILNDGTQQIGIEHQIIIDPKEKKREGFFEDIFMKAEDNLKLRKDLPNFLANCDILPYANFPTNEKARLVRIVERVVEEYIINRRLIDNPIIDDIFSMPHSEISINASLGAWWVRDITQERIEKAIKKKEKLISNYRKDGIQTQWLLLVIGSTGASSFNMNEKLNFKLETQFDKIFILEDFSNILYELD